MATSNRALKSNCETQVNLSIIIVSWNTRDLLAACLESVHANLPPGKCEVWVVDNASTDDSAAMVREHFPQVRLVKNKTNVGFGRANNQAIKQCAGTYVLLLNSDTQVLPGALANLTGFMERHPEAGTAGAHILNPDLTLQTSCSPTPTLSRELWRMLHLDTLHPYGVYRMKGWNQHAPREVDIVMGACMILRREALDQVGLFDEDYFFYSEEEDLCLRLHRANWRIYWIPGAPVIHYGGQSAQQAPDDMFLRLYQGKLLLFRKHYGRVATQLYKLVLAIAAGVRLIISPIAYLESKPRRQQHQRLTLRYWRLLAALPSL
jgi:GT2 family glycosyltransferase